MLVIVLLLLLTSCGSEFYQAAEDIADDKAIQVCLSKEAMQKKANINVIVEIKNPAVAK